MSFAFLPGKLLISVVGRHKGEKFMAAAREAGARGGTIVFGHAVADSKILQALALADVQQDIVFTLMRDEAPAVIEAVRRFCRNNYSKFSGIAFILPVSGMLVRQSADTPGTNVRRDKMESGYTLLTVIVNHGYAEDVMTLARKAGAKGGTILTGRGTASKEDVTFFGITLVPEKDVLMIVSDKDAVPAILAAVRSASALAEPGGGIVYAMNVEEFILLGQ